MGAKEDRRRNQRRRLFQRDGWQDDTGEWFVMCGRDCGAVLGWLEAGADLRDRTVPRSDANLHLVCVAGCNRHQAARVKRTWKRNATQQKITDMLTATHPRKAQP